MKTLLQLIKKTYPEIAKSSKRIDIYFTKRHIKPIITKVGGIKGSLFKFKSVDNSIHGSGRNHTQAIWFASDKVTRKNYLHLPVKVFCDCEYFNYFLAYALNKHKSALRKKTNEYALNTPAIIKNPNNRPYLCKHLYAVCREIGKIKKDSPVKEHLQESLIRL